MDWIADPDIWISLVTLTALEVILGIDNIIFISIFSAKLPEHERAKARSLGLAFAVILRLALLATIFWLTRLTEPLFTMWERGISFRDLILIGGGLFLLWKSTREIHNTIEHADEEKKPVGRATLAGTIVQILLFDVVFSIDSVITAMGMADQIYVMAAAVIIAVGIMLIFARPVSDFVHRHPTFKMLALSFLILIAVALIGEGLELHIPKNYIYFAMGFSFVNELLNMRLRKSSAAAKKPDDTPVAGHGS